MVCLGKATPLTTQLVQIEVVWELKGGVYDCDVARALADFVTVDDWFGW